MQLLFDQFAQLPRCKRHAVLIKELPVLQIISICSRHTVIINERIIVVRGIRHLRLVWHLWHFWLFWHFRFIWHLRLIWHFGLVRYFRLVWHFGLIRHFRFIWYFRLIRYFWLVRRCFWWCFRWLRRVLRWILRRCLRRGLFRCMRVGNHISVLRVPCDLRLILLNSDLGNAVGNCLPCLVAWKILKGSLPVRVCCQGKGLSGLLAVCQKLYCNPGRSQLILVIGIVPDLGDRHFCHLWLVGICERRQCSFGGGI